MSKFKGTKEKWTISKSVGFIADEKENFAIVKVFCNRHISEEEQHFNLKLIAHAPELLEALKDLLNQDRVKEAMILSGENSILNDKIKEYKELIKSATE